MQGGAFDNLYRATKEPRLQTHAWMVLLTAEQGLRVPQITSAVSESEATVLRWLKRYQAKAVEWLKDACAMPWKLLGDHLGLSGHIAGCRTPMTIEFGVDVLVVDVQYLIEYSAEHTGIQLSDETARHALKAAGIVCSALPSIRAEVRTWNRRQKALGDTRTQTNPRRCLLRC
jgi:hypothetical protein